MSKHICPLYKNAENFLLKEGTFPIAISLIVIAAISIYLLINLVDKKKMAVLATAWVVYVFMP